MEDGERMLQDEVVSACRESLVRGAARRRELRTKGDWSAWREEVLGVIRGAFPPWIFGRPNSLNPRLVSVHVSPCRRQR